MMQYIDFLNRIIDDAIAGVNKDYSTEADKQKREASLRGLEICRDKDPQELYEIYCEALEYVNSAAIGDVSDRSEYWWFRHYQLEIEWVCNVVSAAIMGSGYRPILDHQPTARGYMKAAEILGVSAGEPGYGGENKITDPS